MRHALNTVNEKELKFNNTKLIIINKSLDKLLGKRDQQGPSNVVIDNCYRKFMENAEIQLERHPDLKYYNRKSSRVNPFQNDYFISHKKNPLTQVSFKYPAQKVPSSSNTNESFLI